MVTLTSVDGILCVDSGQFTISQTVGGVALDSLDVLGLRTAASASDLTTTTDWVDEKAPALKINYNENTQQLEFRVDRTVLGTGTESNFNSFSVFGATTAEASNNLGIPTQDDASTVLIRGGEVLTTEAFVADGEEIQLNDKRFGITVKYNSDTKASLLQVEQQVNLLKQMVRWVCQNSKKHRRSRLDASLYLKKMVR